MKVVFVFDNFGPYHLARMSAASLLSGIEVVGIELHPKSRTYAWESNEAEACFPKISLPNMGLSGRAERFALLPHLERALESCLPEVVFVNGWGDFMSLETIRWAKKHRVRLVVMSETRRRDGARHWCGEWVKSRIVSLCDAGLCGGETQRSYLRELGLSKNRIALGYNAVDNDFFFKKAKRDREFFQSSVGESKSAPYFLASNRFVERKNLGQLVRAYGKYVGSLPEGKEAWSMVLLGDGQLRVELEELCAEFGLRTVGWLTRGVTESHNGECFKLNYYKIKTLAESGLVVFAGFRQVEELPFFYGGAGVFIHPALSEPWGLVINEAMASGLPILSSGNVGAAEELVQEGVNGYLFDPEDVEELAGLMARMAGMSAEERLAMGRASERLIMEWGPERFASGAQEAVRAAMSAPMKCAGILDRILLEVLILR